MIKSLKINNLRNIEAAEISPHSALNIIHGDNGAGKTSVLESLVVLAKGKSFRSGNIASLIGPCGDSFSIFTRLSESGGKETTMGLERSSVEWSARINGENTKQISDLAPHLPLLIFEPNSHLLVSGPPDGRRKFLDWGVFHVKHEFLDQWRRYSRALKQRNAALRAKSRSVVESLDLQVSRLGEQIDSSRKDQLETIMEKLLPLLKQLSPDLAPIQLDYERGWAGESLEATLAVTLDRDMERGNTGAGPHRADITIRQEGKPARELMSRGEQKILAAAMLLAQASIMSESRAKPMLLLDDLASEFDRFHLESVFAACKDLDTQTWVTGTSPEPYQQIGPDEYSMFHVKQGKISTL